MDTVSQEDIVGGKKDSMDRVRPKDIVHKRLYGQIEEVDGRVSKFTLKVNF